MNNLVVGTTVKMTANFLKTLGEDARIEESKQTYKLIRIEGDVCVVTDEEGELNVNKCWIEKA